MKMTYQCVSESGSFGTPEGSDVEHGTKGEAGTLLNYWEREHYHVGSNESNASMLAWVGTLDDVQDIYPDFQVVRGSRGGIVWISL